MAADPFGRFLTDLGRAPNETSKRELFIALAATGFEEAGFATELALGAEYGVRFSEAGLLRRGAVDSFFGNLIVEFEHDLRRTRQHALEQLQGYVAGAWHADGSTARAYLAVASDGLRWEVLTPRLADPAGPVDSANVALETVETWAPRADGTDSHSLRDFLNRLFFRRFLIPPTAADFVRDFGLASPAFRRAGDELVHKLGELAADRSVLVKRRAWHDALQNRLWIA